MSLSSCPQGVNEPLPRADRQSLHTEGAVGEARRCLVTVPPPVPATHDQD